MDTVNNDLPPSLQKWLDDAQKSNAGHKRTTSRLIAVGSKTLSKLSLRGVVIACGVGMTLIGLFPPWISRIGSRVYDRGYAFVTYPPMGRGEVDFGRLFVEWIVGAMISGIIIFFISTRKEDQAKE